MGGGICADYRKLERPYDDRSNLDVSWIRSRLSLHNVSLINCTATDRQHWDLGTRPQFGTVATLGGGLAAFCCKLVAERVYFIECSTSGAVRP